MRKMMIIVALMVSQQVVAQDPHFSQYFASPITLNPANAGAFNGTMRVAANYRSQWWGVGAPYNTTTVSADGFLLRNGENNKLAFSLMALSDASSAGALKSNFISGGLSYHLGLDESSRSLGLGFSAVYAEKRLDYSKLSFASQFMSGGFNTNVSSGETFAGKTSYVNLNLGALYQFNTDIEKSYVGLAVFNLLDEKLSFNEFSGFQEDVRARYSLNAGYNKLTESNNAFSFSGSLMYQGGATEAIFGGAYSWLLPGSVYEGDYLTAGVWHRVKDAVIPYVGLSYGDLQIGLNYDITVSGARLQTPKNGSMELSLIYTARRAASGIKCPVF
jgi:type IX secretion system PorP/SprF family membrane protein